MPDQTTPFQQIFDELPIAVSLIDPLGRQIGCNRAYADLFGYSMEELVELDVGRITRPTDRDWTRAYLTQLWSGDIDEFVTDKVYVRKDGSEFTARLSARAIRDEDGTCSMMVATISPLAVRAETNASRAQRLLEFTTDTVTIVGVDGAVRETTGRTASTLGYPPEFWNERSILDLVVEEDQSKLLELRERLLAEPTSVVETEIEVRAADGSSATLAAVAANRLDDPDIAGFVLTTRNVTEHLRTLAELMQRRDTAEAVADAQTRLLATVSHELRNPLHAVQGLAELLADEDLPPTAAELAETLRRQLSGLTQVTQDLLDAARFDAGTIVFEPEPTSLAALLDDVAAVGRSAAAAKGVDVSSSVAADVPDWVLVDGARLRQLLSNLVGNAVKFTPAGSVHLVARRGGDDAVVNLSIVDTGVGIPPDEHDTVLEPFRVASTGGDGRGAGLGLSVVQRLVDAMGGRLTMASEVGRGTRFDVWLDLEPCDPVVVERATELPPGLRILVVEDNPVNQHLARSQLERLGLVPVVVGTGERAIELLDGDAGRSIDVVLMDHQLPGISGIETTRLIRERSDAIATLPVIGLSASASSADADAFRAAGMDDFLAKPASLDDLAGALARARSIDRSDVEAHADVVHADDSVRPDLDLDVLERLAGELGDRSIVGQLVETFLAELDGRIEAITSALDAGDDEASRRAAHTLKSSARLLGATRLADACLTVEQGEATDPDVAAPAASARELMTGWLAREQDGRRLMTPGAER